MALADAPNYGTYLASVTTYQSALGAPSPRDRAAVKVIRDARHAADAAYLIALREDDAAFAAAEQEYADACASGDVSVMRATLAALDMAAANADQPEH